jgi:hypothetical protein
MGAMCRIRKTEQKTFGEENGIEFSEEYSYL